MLRLSVTLPGSAALGAYQAGAVGALSVAIEALRRAGREVRVDAVGGSSAGSLVALFLAHGLLTGARTDDLVRRAWVDEVSVDLLRSRGWRAPLDFVELRGRIGEFLDEVEQADDDLGRQDTPLALHVGLTNLLGLTYDVTTADSDEPGLTYDDWGDFLLEPGGGAAQLVEPEGRSPLDFALASASHPAAFAPRLLDRSHERETYERNGITNFPEAGGLWYSDGGLVETEPIGRVLAAARRHTGPADGVRLHIVVDPRSSGPSGSEQWADPDRRPSWLAGMSRALAVLPSQVLHEDLRRVARNNERLHRIDELVDELEGSAGGNPDELRRTLEELAGVAGMERIDVEVVSPLTLSRERDQAGVPELLAGEFIGAFGGFLSRRLRESDFELGWETMATWIPDGLGRHGVDDDEMGVIADAIDERRGRPWREVNAGRYGIGELEPGARLSLARLGARLAGILAVEVLPPAVSGRLRHSSRRLNDDGGADATSAADATSDADDGDETGTDADDGDDGAPHPFLRSDGPLALAHRGDRRRHPPGNTWTALASAVDLGVHVVETDVQTSADGVVVLFHDDRLDDATTGSGAVGDHDWADLRRLRYRHDGRELDDGLVPFADVLDRWPDLRLNVDVKTDAAVEPVVELVHDRGALDRVCLTAFDRSRIGRIRRLAGDGACTGLARWEIVAVRVAAWTRLPVPTPGHVVQVPRRRGPIPVVDRTFLRAAHGRGLHVHVWTVDDPAEMRRLLDLGVDGLITNDPATLLDVIRSRDDAR